MDVAMIIEVVSTLGFPIVCVIAMGWFIYKIYQRTTEENAANMEKVQQRCAEREEKLYQEIKENREVNAKAIETIALYADRLTRIEDNVEDIRSDVLIIKGHLGE